MAVLGDYVKPSFRTYSLAELLRLQVRVQPGEISKRNAKNKKVVLRHIQRIAEKYGFPLTRFAARKLAVP